MSDQSDLEVTGPKVRVKGWRKLLVALALIAVAAFMEISPTQADVLKTVAYVFVGGNAVEHLMGGSTREKVVGMVNRFRGNRPDSARDEQE